MGNKLYTIGYEGMSLDAFVQRLKACGIDALIDVREVPLSRKRGFSKTSLSEVVKEVGIRYAHFPALGCPKPIRDRFKADGDWRAYTRTFLSYLAKQGDALDSLAAQARKESLCLLCFEADFNKCHRSFVARAAARSGGLKVIHITDQTEVVDVSRLVAA